MDVLLLRPAARERFGLGPFFRTEPLGLEYLGAALVAAGHRPRIVDSRLERRGRELSGREPGIVGISCIHTIDVPASVALCRQVRRRWPSCRVVVGGGAAAADAEAFAGAADLVGQGAGERSFVALADALERGGDFRSVAGFREPGSSGGSEGAAPEGFDPELTPARELVRSYRRGYRCVHKSPVWAVETARGCPFRCRFCAVDHTVALRSMDAVRRDFAAVGPDLFVVDDLFFHPRERSVELADALRRAGSSKDWILAQTRTDTVVRNVEALEAWRPLAQKFDLFFGFESSSDEELARLRKDATMADAREAVKLARGMGFGVTGNFVIDPDWQEADFERLWTALEELALDRVGFTVLTPLPGTEHHRQMLPRVRERDASRWDMHHVLWEPRLGRRRFYELVVESWKHNVLASGHASRRWRSWFRGLGLRDALTLAGVLWQTQRLLRVDAYLSDTFPEFPAVPSD